jgi:hypothetical protein
MTFSRAVPCSSDDPRNKALSSAMVLRDCSLRPQTSHATRRACRTLMREQAIKWRQPPALRGTV